MVDPKRTSRKPGWARLGCKKSRDGLHENELVSTSDWYACKHCGQFND